MAIAATAPIEWSRETRANWFLALGAGEFVIGFVSLGIFAIRDERRKKRTPLRQIDEGARDRETFGAALWMASVVGSLVLISAGPVTWLGLLIDGGAMAWTLVWIPRWPRQLGFRTTTVIGRDQSTVFSFLVDERNDMRYIPELESVEKLTEGPIARGTRFCSRVKVADGVLEGVDEIVDYQAPNEITTRTVTSPRPNLGVMRFESVPDGTRVTYRFDSEITYANAVMGQGLWSWTIKLDLIARREAAWKRLKQLLETHA